MKKIKRMLIISMVIAALGMVLCGCGSADSSSQQETTAASETTEAKTEPPTEATKKATVTTAATTKEKVTQIRFRISKFTFVLTLFFPYAKDMFFYGESVIKNFKKESI